MPARTYRWLLITLAVVGLTADQVTKYQVFRWLYNEHRAVDHGAFQTWVQAERWGEKQDEKKEQIYLMGGRFDLVSGWFGFTAEFDPTIPTCDCGFQKLQTWTRRSCRAVNHGALFGMGGEHKGKANGVFMAVSVVAAIAILIWGMRRSTAREKWLMAALGLILAGPSATCTTGLSSTASATSSTST